MIWTGRTAEIFSICENASISADSQVQFSLSVVSDDLNTVNAEYVYKHYDNIQAHQSPSTVGTPLQTIILLPKTKY